MKLDLQLVDIWKSWKIIIWCYMCICYKSDSLPTLRLKILTSEYFLFKLNLSVDMSAVMWIHFELFAWKQEDTLCGDTSYDC